MSWLWIFKFVWNRSSNSSNFSDFPSRVGNVVERDLRNFEILIMLLLKLAELLLVANCWRANKISSASIVAGVFSLPNCGLLVERAFFCFPDEVPGSSRESLLELLSPFDGSLPALDRLDYQCERQRTPLRDRDRLGNDPQWVPSFPICCSWMFPEQLRNKSELVGSDKIQV